MYKDFDNMIICLHPYCPYCKTYQTKFDKTIEDDTYIADYICEKCEKNFDITCEIETKYICWKIENDK